MSLCLSPQAQEIDLMISCQDSAMDAVRLELLLRPKEEKINTIDCLDKLQVMGGVGVLSWLSLSFTTPPLSLSHTHTHTHTHSTCNTAEIRL